MSLFAGMRSWGIAKTIVLGVAVLALVGGAAFFILKKEKQPDSPSVSGKDTINVGIQISDSPGLNYMQDGQRMGFEADLANYIAQKLGKHANFIPMTVGTRDQQLKNGYIDMVAGTYSITDARIEDGIVFAGPYIRTDQGIMTLKSNTDIMSVDDLAGQTVCVTAKSTSEQKINDLKSTVKLLVTQRDTLDTCIADMRNPSMNVAAVTSDTVILQGYARQDTSLRYVPRLVIPGAYEKYGVGLSAKNIELCKQTATIVKDFLNTQWNSAFSANIQSDANSTAQNLKPDPSSVDTESCRIN